MHLVRTSYTVCLLSERVVDQWSALAFGIVRPATTAEAEALCAGMANCAGFTFSGKLLFPCVHPLPLQAVDCGALATYANVYSLYMGRYSL